MIRNIMIYGVGGVGGYFGGRLASFYEKSAEIKVSFAARGEHLDQIMKNGLLLKTGNTVSVCRPFSAGDDIKKLPRPDIVLLCVKEYDLEAAVRDIAIVSGKETGLIPLLNGVDIVRRIRRFYNEGILLPGCAYVGTHIERPGIVAQSGSAGRIYIGNERGRSFEQKETVELFTRAGIDCRWYDDPYPAIWGKYLFVASYGMVTAFSGKPIGEVYADPETLILVRNILEEIAAISVKKGPGKALPDGIIEETIEKARLFTPDAKTSYQRDLESGGKNEGNIFGMSIISMGKEENVPTPVTEEISAKINLKYFPNK